MLLSHPEKDRFRTRSVVINRLKPSGYYMYHQFNIHKFYTLPTQCVYVFCMDLRKKHCDYFSTQH